ncbi:unnamed protein product [Coregonus sp. 'balchen']|nr:unnamed protein product [Coregonus sp. 'balchen']
MATFISVPLKKSSEVDLVKPLSKFVTATYPAGEEQAEYIRSVEELNKLRKSALGRPLDKHESSLEILLRYYDQLCAVEPKFPFSENQLCLTFTWKDAFDKGSLFGGSVKLALASLGYEKTCVLFNGAALANFYGDAFKQCQYKENLPKYIYFQEVLPVLAAKHCIMQAYAELHQSLLAKQKKRFGEEIARLQHATELVKTVASRYDEYVSVKDLSDKISRALTAAKKDNDFIYHDRVPEVKDLEHIGKAALVKATAITPPLSANVLASLNLPAALEDLSGDSIPQSIMEKARAIVQQGGLQSIEQLIRDLPELLTRNREILDESLKMLGDEESTDSELRSKFSQRWNRTPSGDLYKPLRAEGGNFRSVLDKAVQADQVVKERYNAHCEMIALLCKPEAELTAAIPSANPAKTLQGSEVVSVLRSQLAQLVAVKGERDGLEAEIKGVTFDMSSSFLTALAQDGAINEEALSMSQLDQSYGSYNQKVQASLRSQEELLGKVQESHQEFSKLKQSNSEANDREEVLKKLASAHDSYVEITSNLREGTKNKCSDIVFARKTERDELLKDLQQSIAREPSAPSFSVPAYQTNPAPTATEPSPAPRTVFQPQRPPPPAFTPQATSAPDNQPQPGNPSPMAPPPQAQGPPYPTYQGYPGPQHPDRGATPGPPPHSSTPTPTNNSPSNRHINHITHNNNCQFYQSLIYLPPFHPFIPLL